MEHPGMGREYGTIFFGIVTNGNHIIKVNVPVFIDIIGGMLRDINPIFFHYFNGLRIHPMGFYAGTIHLSPIICKMPDITFSYLAPATITCTKN